MSKINTYWDTHEKDLRDLFSSKESFVIWIGFRQDLADRVDKEQSLIEDIVISRQEYLREYTRGYKYRGRLTSRKQLTPKV